MPPDVEYISRMQRELLKQGKLIEAAWVRFRGAAIPVGAPEVQVFAMRVAYFMGAHNLYTMLEAPIDDDVLQVTQISVELQEFITEYTLRYVPSDGTA